MWEESGMEISNIILFYKMVLVWAWDTFKLYTNMYSVIHFKREIKYEGVYQLSNKFSGGNRKS